jgi:hypothetical protein
MGMSAQFRVAYGDQCSSKCGSLRRSHVTNDIGAPVIPELGGLLTSAIFG